MNENPSLAHTLRMVTPAPTPADQSPSSEPDAEAIVAAQLPYGVSRTMAEWFIVSGERAGQRLVADAQPSVPWPEQLHTDQQAHSSKRVLYVGREHGINLFENVPPPSPSHSAFAHNLWDQIRLKKPAKTGVQSSRLFGTSFLYAPVPHIAALLGPQSLVSTSLLYPGATRMSHIHTLLDLGHEHACLRLITLPARRGVREPRDFLVLEYRHCYQLPASGRNVCVVTYHSVTWKGSPSELSRDAVRGSFYTSGVVAIESEATPGRVELFCVVEINLKGQATARDNAEAAHRHVFRTLSRTAVALEKRAMDALQLDAASVFEMARRAALHRHHHVCTTCATETAALTACRKCYAILCGACVSSSRYARQQFRFCISCRHRATAVLSGLAFSMAVPVGVATCA